MDLFLTDLQVKKIAILRFLVLNNNTVLSKDLALEFNVSIKSVNRYCQSLDEDLIVHFDKALFFIDNHLGIITLKGPQKAVPSYVLNYLTFYYVRDSINFKIINALLSGRFKNVVDLADSLYLTPASLYAHLYQLDPILKEFDLSFNWEKQVSGLNFVYDEKKIRYFAYLFYWKYYKGLIPLSSGQNTNEINKAIEKYFTKNEFISKKQQFTYLAHINCWLHHQTKPLLITTQSLNMLRTISSVLDYSVILKTVNPLTSEDECLFFNLLVRISISSVDSFETKSTIVSLFKKENSQIFQSYYRLHDKLLSAFNCTASEEDSIIFFYNMIFLSLYNTEISIPIENEFLSVFNSNFYKDTSNMQSTDLEKIYHLYLSEINTAKPFSKNLSLLICWNLVTSQQAPDKIKISVNYSQNALGDSLIKKRIIQLFNSELIEFTTEMANADIVISDSTYFAESQQQFIYMDRLTDPLCWNNLFNTLQRKVTTSE